MFFVLVAEREKGKKHVYAVAAISYVTSYYFHMLVPLFPSVAEHVVLVWFVISNL